MGCFRVSRSAAAKGGPALLSFKTLSPNSEDPVLNYRLGHAGALLGLVNKELGWVYLSFPSRWAPQLISFIALSWTMGRPTERAESRGFETQARPTGHDSFFGMGRVNYFSNV